MSLSASPQPGRQAVQRQIVLPLSMALEIAWKSIRMRLTRSLLVTSGIVLALAFLTSILATEAIVDSMRAWAAQPEAEAAAGPSAEASRRLELERLLVANGVATGEADVQAARLQSRWLVGLALLVALAGILNAMLMSVTERFREIGTMKCLGALDSFIVKLFLLESLFQGIAGTAVGVVLGLILSLASLVFSYGAFAWVNFPAVRLLGAVALALGVGVVLTVAGAVYPAWQAARMQPIEAMRVET